MTAAIVTAGRSSQVSILEPVRILSAAGTSATRRAANGQPQGIGPVSESSTRCETYPRAVVTTAYGYTSARYLSSHGTGAGVCMGTVV
jgi:hypothetical protein